MRSVQELFFCDRSIRRAVYSNDLVKFFGCNVQQERNWEVMMYMTCLQINVDTILFSNRQFDSFFDTTHTVIGVTRAHA